MAKREKEEDAAAAPIKKRDRENPFVRVGAATLLDSPRTALTAPVEYKVMAADQSSSGGPEVLALSDGKRIAYALLEERPDGELYLSLVLTLWPFRGQGVARGLVAQVEKYGRDHGFSVVTGEVSVNEYTTGLVEVERRADWFKLLGFEATQDGRQFLIRKPLK